WMMPSDVELFGRVEMSVFHGFAASKSRLATVVVVGPVVVVVVVAVPGCVVDVVDDGSPPHWHVEHTAPPAQSAAVSHSSPASTSTRPSPQVDAAAGKRWRLAPRA